MKVLEVFYCIGSKSAYLSSLAQHVPCTAFGGLEYPDYQIIEMPHSS